MTDPTTPAAAPGWYPDASGNQRWWDGRGWTEHVAAPAASAAAYERPQLPEGTRLDTAWVWLIAVLPVIGIIPLFAVDMRGYMRASMAQAYDPTMALDPLAAMIGIQALAWGLSFVIYALTVVAAFRDYRHLLSVGAVRPFHWAFAFIPYAQGLVYLIGRHVVLRRMSRTPGAPLWVHVGVNVLLIVVSIVWFMVIFAQMMSELASMYPSGTYS